jgi:hypothetical protein
VEKNLVNCLALTWGKNISILMQIYEILFSSCPIKPHTRAYGIKTFAL